MELKCNPDVAAHLHSGSKRAGFITERWFAGYAYCLACGSNRLNQTKANTPARDYICPSCSSPYELKSSLSPLGRRVVDGAYQTMMQRIAAAEAPTLMLLRYANDWAIRDLLALHSVFLTPAVIEQRAPLGPNARRAGWVGCNLRIDRIPVDGRIPLIQDGVECNRPTARSLFRRSSQFAELKPAQRGWAALVLAAVRRIGRAEFRLADVYAFEQEMHAAYPQNSHVRDKIRQQMQVLRDLGYVEFVGRGEYKVTQ